MNEYRYGKVTLIFPVLILTSFILAYWPVFLKLEHQWSAGDNSYAYLIVPLFLYLLWERKDRFRFDEFSWSIWGLVPAVLSVILILIGELGSVRALLFIGLWGCVVGLTILLYGRRTRHLIFPLLILFFIVPLPPFLNQVLTFKLKMIASKLSVMMLRAVGVPVFLEGNIIDIGIEKLHVADACSGLRYFMPMIVMATLVAYFFVRGVWRWIVILVMIFPLSILINSLRIWISALFVVNGHPELSQSLFHDFSGWLMFMIATGFLILLAVCLERIGRGSVSAQGDATAVSTQTRKTPHTASPETGTRQVGGWLRPAFLTVIFCLLFAGGGWTIQQIPSASHLPARTSFEHFPMEIGEWHGKRNYISKKVLHALWADDYVSATYARSGSSNLIYLFIPFYKYQVTNHTVHAPQACLLGGGFVIRDAKERKIHVSPGKDINIMTMVLEKGDTRMLGSYFFLEKGRVITSPWMNKFYLIWDGITKHRTDGALVRVEMLLGPNQGMDKAFKELEGFIAKLWPILPRFIPN